MMPVIECTSNFTCLTFSVDFLRTSAEAFLPIKLSFFPAYPEQRFHYYNIRIKTRKVNICRTISLPSPLRQLP